MKNNLTYDNIINVKRKFLSQVEYEEQKQELTNIVNNLFPNLPDLNQQEYKSLKEKIQNGDKIAERKIKDFSIKVASEYLIEYFLTRDVSKYDFADALQDLFVIIEEKYHVCSNTNYISEYKFYISSFVMRNFVAKLRLQANANLDIKCSFEGNFNEINSVDDICIKNNNEEEYCLLHKELAEELKEYIHQLPPRDCKLLNLYFGLNGHKRLNMPEIAKVYGVTYSAIQLYVSQALKELRKLKYSNTLRDYKDGFEF